MNRRGLAALGGAHAQSTKRGGSTDFIETLGEAQDLDETTTAREAQEYAARDSFKRVFKESRAATRDITHIPQLVANKREKR